jgi:hypothetical protein
MERKLAYIATISKLESIPGKDRIVYASFKEVGWQVIVANSFKMGDKVVYVEIDSILPVKPEYEFLRKRCFSAKLNGFVINGMRMAGLVSYGIALDVPKEHENKQDGFDMTDILKIRKKEDNIDGEIPANMSKFKRIKYIICGILLKLHIIRKKPGITSTGWLSFISKTDETRIENLPYLFEKSQGLPVYSTVKCDGMSVTFAIYKKHFYIASRNIVVYCESVKKALKDFKSNKFKLSQDKFIKVAVSYNIAESLSHYMNTMAIYDSSEDDYIVIQGELCGPGIQKNPMGLKEVDYFIFNVFIKNWIYNGNYMHWNIVDVFCNTYGLKTVPIIERKNFDWPDKAALKEYAKGEYPNGRTREGVVIRYDGTRDMELMGNFTKSTIWSFKCINDDYIIK